MTKNSMLPKKSGMWMALTFLFISVSLSSCSRLRNYTDQELEDRQKLMKIYENITGTYEGKVTVGGEQELSIELLLYTIEVREGVDADGNNRFRPILKAKYRNKNTVGESDDEVLDVRYFPQNGEILLTSSNLESAASFISARGTLLDHLLKAEITKNGGLYGTIEVQRTSEQSTSPSDGFEAERRARLRQLYNVITGTYKANLKQPGSKKDYPIEIAVYINEIVEGTNPSGETRLRPQLEARYRAIEDPYNEWDSSKLDVRYYYETGEVIMYAKDANIGSFTIRSFFAEESFNEGEITTEGGLFGRFTAKRTSRDVIAPSDDETSLQRLRRLYEKLEGTYNGTLRTNSREKKPIEIKIFIIDEVGNNGQTVPTLKARYRRVDFNPGIGEFYLAVRYFTRTESIVLTSAAIAGGTIPGAGTMSINGKWANGKIYDAELIDHRGPQGTLTARK